MSRTVEMFREGAELNESDRFACTLTVWQLLQELGRTFGWHPKGTTYVAPPARKSSVLAARDYQPGDASDRKRVETDDARAWARALEAALQSGHLAAMLEGGREAEAGSTEGLGERLPLVIHQFIEFSYRGAFEFALAGAESDGAKG